MIYIGVPTINLKKYLQETVESIQTKYDWKLLIVDNGSNDGFTQEWIEQSGHDYILNGHNAGVAAAWNQILYWGLAHDDVEVIFILNNDIHLHPKAMDNMVESMLEGGKQGISGVMIGEHPDMLGQVTWPEPRYSPAMNFSCFGFTIPLITRVGFFDENFKIAYFEDNDYHHRMREEGIDASCDLWAPFAHYRSRTINEAGIAPLHDAFRQNRDYFRRKWGFLPGEKGEPQHNG